MTQGAKRWLELIYENGAGTLAPMRCRDNLLAAENLLSSCNPQPIHFAEFPLLGEQMFDMTWTVSFSNVINASSLPPELAGAKHFATDMDPKGIIMFEYDTSKPQLPPPGLYFKGKLSDGGHAIGRLLECFDRASEARSALLVVAKLAKLGYTSLMCGIMAGRKDAPVRVTAKPIGNFDAVRLLEDLSFLGFKRLPLDSFSWLNQLCVPNDYLFSAPLVYLDVMSDGSLGSTLGIEFSGIRKHNIDNYPQLQLACNWGIADSRWEVLRDASFKDDYGFFFAPNTLKFRWCDGNPLPAKLYMKAGW